MGVEVLQIIEDCLIAYGLSAHIINGLIVVVYASAFIGIVYAVAMAPSRVIAMYKGCKNFFANLKLQCKKPPKSVGSEIDGSNNSLN